MGAYITENRVFLSNHITNLTEILNYLEERYIISQNESERIETKITTLEKNTKLLDTIQRKKLNKKLFLEILRNTKNQHCVNEIEGYVPEVHPKHPKIAKWWPDKKFLINPLHKRKIGCRLLVEELHDLISKDKNRMVVTTESADASIYANHNEEYYDHILWIDCGDGRLEESFKKLAGDLEIQNRNELVHLEEFSMKRFDELVKWKCLWIYDNAERYIGREGIIKVLPKNKENFFCLITSRSREWYVENVGFEKISDLQLDVFNEQESLNKETKLHPKITKWWPDKKLLIKSLHHRKIGSQLLVEVLHGRIMKDDNRMVVITESADASKYSAMGGVGKTLTAKWYAHKYEEEYQHILWIDCGDGRLKESFKKLARDLKVEDRNELLDLEDYSRKSYKELEKWKCLWIYDNAESYKGDKGIIKVLPVEKLSFSCLITSRSREWGVENVGHGKISDLPLNVFSEKESLEFLKHKLAREIKHTDSQLKELSLLLGNLPLALQLAIAELNNGKLDVKSYIDKNKFAKVVDGKFDDYEKTISGNVNISLDLILKEENGEEAHDILKVFGYIRPDDINVEFFKAAFNLEDERKIERAIKLLKKYSFIGKSKIEVFKFENDIKKEIKMVLSIHRLLQQVIRHNAREVEKETLRKILNCEGFMEYKLIPFTQYADEELRREFPKVKELLDQQQLKKLVKEERFEESVQLAKFIDEELKTTTTKFNYAICLDKNGQLEECLKTLEKLFTERESNENFVSRTLEKMLQYIKTKELKINVEKDWALVELKEEATEMEIGTLLFYSYLTLGNIDDALAVGKQTANEEEIFRILSQFFKEKRFVESVQLAKFIHEELKTNTSKLNYAICLDKSEQLEECVEILEELDKQEMKEKGKYEDRSDVEMGIVRLEKEIGRDLVVGHLLVVYWRMDKKRFQQILDERQHFTIIHSDESLDSLIRIVSSDLMTRNYSFITRYTLIELDLNVTTKAIHLCGCSLSLSSFDVLAPEELNLSFMSFSRDGVELEQVTVNQFIDFRNTKRLSLLCYEKNNMVIDLSGDVSMDYLYLWNVQVLNWKDASWEVQTLKLEDIPFVETTKMKVKEMKIFDSSLDISCLPPTIQQLYLNYIEVEQVFVSGGIDLPELKHLTLSKMDSSSFSHFSSLPLTHLHFDAIKELNLSLLPPIVTQIKISYNYFGHGTKIVGGRKILDKLILHDFSFKGVDECLRHFQTDYLVIHGNGISSSELLELMSKKIKTIAVGEINYDFKILFSQVDRKAKYYLLEGGKWKGMEKKEFEYHLELF